MLAFCCCCETQFETSREPVGFIETKSVLLCRSCAERNSLLIRSADAMIDMDSRNYNCWTPSAHLVRPLLHKMVRL
jgi:hypothetical protein